MPRTMSALISKRARKRRMREGYPQEVIGLGNVAQFWRLTRELDVRALRDAFERSVTIRVLGSDQATARRVARLIEPDPLAGEISSGILGEDSARGDLVVVGIG